MTDSTRVWAAEPAMSGETLREATGKGWDEWADVLDAWPGHGDGHTAIATYLQEEQGVDGWWAQTITVGYERIAGLRLPYQRPDGTFSAGKSRTLKIDVGELRRRLLDDDARSQLFPGQGTTMRSKPASKVLRIGIGPGVAQISFDPQPDGKVMVSVIHERLPSADDVDTWKAYWSDWLENLDES